MTQRLSYMKESGELFRKFVQFSNAVDGALPKPLHDLVTIRASQINGCAFCLDMHIKQAVLRGEPEQRIHHIAVFRESPLFDARERAVLEWTEAVTKLGEHGISDEVYQRVRAELSEKEVSDLTFLIATINAWNRLNIAFRNVPGAYDKEFGLDKAQLRGA